MVFSYAGFVLITAQIAYVSLSYSSPVQSQNELQLYRLLFGIYALGFSIITFLKIGIWPFVTYTVTSWNLMAFRLIFAYLSDAGLHSLRPVASFLKFPALVGCTITVFIWWSALVPLIAYLLRHNEKDQSIFLRFNLSFGLINLHLFNLPITAVEFLWTSTPLTFFDLWCGYFVALLYCLFYLNVLDPLGLHFYIIFSPRTAFCALSFGLVIGAYYAFYVFWNSSLTQ